MIIVLLFGLILDLELVHCTCGGLVKQTVTNISMHVQQTASLHYIKVHDSSGMPRHDNVR